MPLFSSSRDSSKKVDSGKSPRDPVLSKSAHGQLEGNPAAYVHHKTLAERIAEMPASAKGIGKPNDVAALQSKFEAGHGCFAYTYGSVKDFFAGLEGLIGSPSSDVMTAMERDHASTKPFDAYNGDKMRTTTPRAEWDYVVEKAVGEQVDDPEALKVSKTEGHFKLPSHKMDSTAMDNGRQDWKLQNFADQPAIKKAGCLIPEVAGIRLYTGPMYAPYQAVLRGVNSKEPNCKAQKDLVALCCDAETEEQFKAETMTFELALAKANWYTTTLHAINSGIVKLSKQTPAAVVYRGVAGGVLPKEFWEKNEDGVFGGVDLAFMSTTPDRDVALGYMKQGNKLQKILFEIRMGMIDRGADVSSLSQYPGEREILFAPLTGLEVAAIPRIEDGVMIIELRLSCNMQAQTIEQVIGKMKTSHIDLLNTFMDDMRLSVHGLPPAVLDPLVAVKANAQGRDRQFYMKPKQYLGATNEAFDAQDECYVRLADKKHWETVGGDGALIVRSMRQAAEKCNEEGRPKEAAALLKMAVERAGGVPKEHQQGVDVKMKELKLEYDKLHPGSGWQPEPDARLALLAACSLLATNALDSQWTSALMELGVLAGDRYTVGRLAQLYGYSANVAPDPDYADLPLDGYKMQPFFHQINTKSRNLQLVQDEPYVFLHPGFLTPDECRQAMALFALSSKKGSSATSEAQTKARTSNSVVYGVGTELPLLMDVRERIAALAGVDVAQLQATKITCYEKGQFFTKHTDAMNHTFRIPWVKRLVEGKETAEQLTAPGEACFMPEKFCTVWIYLNSVGEGGNTRFHCSEPDDDLCGMLLPQLGKVFGKQVPGLPKTRSKSKNLSIKPKAGTAVIHFPTTTQEYFGLYDGLAIHEGEPAVDPKYILQQFICWEPLDTVMDTYTATIRSAAAPNPRGQDRVLQTVYQGIFGTQMPSSSADEPVEAS